MAGIFAPGTKLDSVRHHLWLFDVSYLELMGTKNGTSCPLIAVFFHPRHEKRYRRLLAGLVKFCGIHSYAIIRADGKALRHQCAANRLQDADYTIPLEGHDFAAAVSAAFPGWQGESSEWHGHKPHGSFMTAMMRGLFTQIWDCYEDPIAESELRTVRANDKTIEG